MNVQDVLEVTTVGAAAVRPLRSTMLRPGQPPESLIYPGDDAPDTLHVAAKVGDEIVGIASLYREAPPADFRDVLPAELYGEGASFRLRGMAVATALQGRGIGARCFERCLEHVRGSDASHLWCNARVGAVDFYQRMGLRIAGDSFDIPGIGEHYLAWRRV